MQDLFAEARGVSVHSLHLHRYCVDIWTFAHLIYCLSTLSFNFATQARWRKLGWIGKVGKHARGSVGNCIAAREAGWCLQGFKSKVQ